MKAILSILSILSICSFASALGENYASEDIQDIVDAARLKAKESLSNLLDLNKSALLGGVGRSSQLDHEQDNDYFEEESECEMLEESYYNMTAISTAHPVLFTMLSVYDPSFLSTFDSSEFFDSLNFDEECTALGGEVVDVSVDIAIANYSVAIEIETFKLCKPPPCDMFEYITTKMFEFYGTAGWFGFFNDIEVEIEVTHDLFPSALCLSDYSMLYNSTDPDDWSIKAFLENHFDAGMEGNGLYKEYYKKKADVKVTNMEDYTEEVAIIEDLCDGDNTIGHLDIVINMPLYHRTFRRYPHCQPPTCSSDDIGKLYAYMSSVISEMEPVDIDIHLATINSCDETAFNKASMKKKNGNVLAKSCKWLKKRPDSMKEKFCMKNALGGYKSASEVCPSTCCACKEESSDVFLKKSEFSSDGTLSLIKKDCAWLQSVSESVKTLHCEKSQTSYVGGYPPAYIACPETCGNCS